MAAGKGRLNMRGLKRSDRGAGTTDSDIDQAERGDDIDDSAGELLRDAIGKTDAAAAGDDGNSDGRGALQRKRVDRGFRWWRSGQCGTFGLLVSSEKLVSAAMRSD